MFRRALLVMFVVGVASAASAQTRVVEFSEVSLSSGTPLAGTTYFEPYGLGFADGTTYALDSRFIGAGTDNVGIAAESGGSNVMTILFLQPVASVTLDWITVNDSSITAEAFDAGGNLLDTKTQAVSQDPAYGQFTFTGLGEIAKVSVHDAGGTVGVGRLTYTYPAIPAASTTGLVLLAIALLLVGTFALRRALV